MVAGVDLGAASSGPSVSDEDLVRVLATGAPAAGMPAFQAAAAEVTGDHRVHPCRVRRDRGARSRLATPARGQDAVRRQGRLRDLPSRERPRTAASQPISATSAPMRTPPSLQRRCSNPPASMLPANRTGARRDPRRPHDPRPAAQRRHLHGANHRRAGAAGVADQGGPAVVRVSPTSPMPPVANDADAPTRSPT